MRYHEHRRKKQQTTIQPYTRSGKHAGTENRRTYPKNILEQPCILLMIQSCIFVSIPRSLGRQLEYELTNEAQQQGFEK